MDSQSPEAYYKNMPVVTRAIMTATFCITLVSVLGMFNPSYILLNWRLVWNKLHLWRLITDYLFVGPFSFNWIFHMYFFVGFSSRLEQNPCFSARQGGRGSYLYFLFLQMLALDALSLVLYFPTGKAVLAPALSFAIIYYWSKKEPYAPTGLWGFTLTAWQLPYALFVLDLLMGQSIIDGLMGLATGHLYHFVKDVLPVEKNIHLLQRTPELFAVMAEKLDFVGGSSSVSRQGASESRSTSATTYSGAGRVSSLFTSSTTSGTSGNSSHQFPGRGYRLSGDNDTSRPS